MSKTNGIAIVGVGETEYKRPHPDPLLHLIAQAGVRAIENAGLKPEDIDGFVSQPGQPPIDEIAACVGAKRRSFSGLSPYVAGAGTVHGAALARYAIQSGQATAVLVTYGIQTSRPGGPYSFHSADPLKADLEMPFGFFGQPVYFGAMAQRYRYEYGLTPEQLGSIAVSQRQWARLTPGAQKQEPLDLDGYLASPMIAEPLRVRDCCLISDGAGAYVITSSERARDLKNKPVNVAGVGAGSSPVTQSELFTQNPDYLKLADEISSRIAYEQAGITADDLDFAEIYDCFTISMILQLEGLGICPRGEGAAFVENGRIGPGGSFPVNTHGGHLSHAYIPGMNHVIEAVRQLRGERGEGQLDKAEVCAIAGLGGNDHATMVLTSA